MTRGAHLFLSPHLDDAVLSCGGTIHQLTQRGETVIILTIMAGDLPAPPPDTPIIRDLHRRWAAGENPVAIRRQEDLASAQVIGAQPFHRDYPDCVYRTYTGISLYPTEESIFGAVHEADPAAKGLSRESPHFSTAYPQTQIIYAPLGVGHHVDHQIVRDWGLEIRRLNPQLALRFYEEYPYTRDLGAIKRALNLLPSNIRLGRETHPLAENNIVAKIKAVACHQSQISTFWASLEAMEQEIREMFCTDDGLCVERYRRVMS